jgi:hypothetical protein
MKPATATPAQGHAIIDGGDMKLSQLAIGGGLAKAKRPPIEAARFRLH